MDPEQFVDFYTANGWMRGKNTMKDWKASVRVWEKRGFESSYKTKPQQGIQREDDLDAMLLDQIIGRHNEHMNPMSSEMNTS